MAWLVVARHGAAEGSAAGGDRARRLTPGGRREAEGLGAALRARGLSPTEAWVSPYARAQETWAALDFAPSLGMRTDAGLTPEASVLPLAEALRAWGQLAQQDQGLMLVSHLPLVARLTWELGRQEVPFHTASASVLEVMPGGFRWVDHVQDGRWASRG